MNNLAVFSFDNHDVRVINQDPINPLFVAVDVATALGYKKPENAISRHCVRNTTTPKQGGGYMTVIPESDLYRLVFRSKLESAERFTDWVVEEVLPAIRKTGRYEMPKPDTLTPAQQRHIQNRVAYLVRNQVGTSFSMIWSQVKNHFNVGSYKDVPAARYPELCKFLQCEPVHVDELDEEQLLVGALKDQTMIDLKQVFASPITERLFLVIRDGRLELIKDLRGYSIVKSDGYRKISRNLNRIQQQLQWLEGSQDDEILEMELLNLH